MGESGNLFQAEIQMWPLGEWVGVETLHINEQCGLRWRSGTPCPCRAGEVSQGLETQLLHIVFMASVTSQVIAGLFYFAILLKIMIFLFCFSDRVHLKRLSILFTKTRWGRKYYTI